MNLLQKFVGITVKSDTRITETDKQFCQIHQAAYDNARSSLQELSYFWEDILSQQAELLNEINVSSRTYLTSGEGMSLSKQDIQNQLFAVHALFVDRLVSFFNEIYHLSLSVMDIKENLIPQKPTVELAYDYEDKTKEYVRTIQNFSLCYTEILDQIFLYTDGRTLSEQALYELKEKCHKAAWNLSIGKAKFTQKRNTLILNDFFCSCHERYSGDYWELSLNVRDILKGIAHFETGDFSVMPLSICEIIKSPYLTSDSYTFSLCKKVQSLKMYKNRRVDIKFTTESYALQFVSEYLGNIC